MYSYNQLLMTIEIKNKKSGKLANFFPNCCRTVKGTSSQNLPKFRMCPSNFPHRSTVSFPRSSQVPIFMFIFIPNLWTQNWYFRLYKRKSNEFQDCLQRKTNLDELITGACGHTLPIEIISNIVNQIFVLSVDTVCLKHLINCSIRSS